MSSHHSSDSGRRRQPEDQSFFQETPSYGDNDGAQRTAARHPSDRPAKGSSSTAMFVDQWARIDAHGSSRPPDMRTRWIGGIAPSSPIGDGVPPQHSQRQYSGNQRIPTSQQRSSHRDAGHHTKSSGYCNPQQQQQSPAGVEQGACDESNKQLTKAQAPRLEQAEYALPSRFPDSDTLSMDYTLKQLGRELQAAGKFYGEYIDAHAKQLANIAVNGRHDEILNDKILNLIWIQIVSTRIKDDMNERDHFHDICIAIQRQLNEVERVSVLLDDPNWSKPGGALESAMSKQRRVGLKMLVVLVQGIVMTAQTVQRERTSCLAVHNMVNQALAMLDPEKAENLYLYKSKDMGDVVSLGNKAAKKEPSGEAEAPNEWFPATTE